MPKAKKIQTAKNNNSIAATDAIFAFKDGINTLIKAGIKTIVQPGGSMRDQEVINAADKAKIKMFFTVNTSIINQFCLFLQLK